jgi:hypothetical protein
VHAADMPDPDRSKWPGYRVLTLAAQGLVRVAQVLHLLPRGDME